MDIDFDSITINDWRRFAAYDAMAGLEITKTWFGKLVRGVTWFLSEMMIVIEIPY